MDNTLYIIKLADNTWSAHRAGEGKRIYASISEVLTDMAMSFDDEDIELELFEITITSDPSQALIDLANNEEDCTE